MQKNVILATILSTLILFIWWLYFTPTPTYQQKQTQQQTSDLKKEQAQEQTYKYQEESIGETESIKKPIKTSQVKEYVFESDYWKATIGSSGAKLHSYYIKECIPITECPDLIIDRNGKNLSTFSDTDFKLISSKEEKEYYKIIFDAEINNSLYIKKIYQLNKTGDLHNLELFIENKTKKILPFVLTWGPGLGSNFKERKEQNELLKVHSINLIKKNKFGLTKLKKGEYTNEKFGSVGMDNRYFTFTLIDANKYFNKITVVEQKDKKGLNEIFLETEIQPLTEKIISTHFYLGPKLYKNLKKYGSGLEKTIDFGVFADLSKLFLNILNFFYKHFHNYGLAIIFLTIIIQIITLPLTLKSFNATKAMKHIQPKIKEIQEKFKSDPKRMQAEMMHMYKSQKANPFSGCLPLLLQLPIFWGLFAALQNTYELRKANFIFWIKDLSGADPVLPILMGVSMFLQQKMSSPTIDPSQKMFIYLMPVMFTFIFWNFPSGLVLYWLTNNILTITIQFFILRAEKV